MGIVASQITSLTIVYSAVYSGADQRKHQSSASLAFVRGIHRGPGNYPHKWPVTREMFPCDDVIMVISPFYIPTSYHIQTPILFTIPLFLQCIVLNDMPKWTSHFSSLLCRHNGLDSVSNHQSHHCLLSSLFGRRSKKTSKLRVTGLCAWNSPGTGAFPAQMASYAENVSIWWRHHGYIAFLYPNKLPHTNTYPVYYPLISSIHGA